jgi:hypothetical protein
VSESQKRSINKISVCGTFSERLEKSIITALSKIRILGTSKNDFHVGSHKLGLTSILAHWIYELPTICSGTFDWGIALSRFLFALGKSHPLLRAETLFSEVLDLWCFSRLDSALCYASAASIRFP